MLAICLDCNCTRELNNFYKCSTCNSSSVVRPGAIEAVHKLISHANKTEEETDRTNKVLEFRKSKNVSNGNIQKEGIGNAQKV